MIFILIALLIPIIFLTIIFNAKVWTPLRDKENQQQFAMYSAIAFIGSIIIALAMYFGGMSKVNQYEVWNYRITAIQNCERWTTEESRMERYVSGYDKKGNAIYSYRTVYYTETHGPYYYLFDEYNNRQDTDFNTYQGWANFWGNIRNVGTNQGSAHGWDTPITGQIYQADWDRTFNKIFPFSEIKTYENRVRATKNAFNFAEPTKEDLKQFPRPADQQNISPIIGYGVNFSDEEIMLLRRLNADLGVHCKVHFLLVAFDSAKWGPDVVERILAAWQGVNKNELVAFVGLDEKRHVKWVKVESWQDNTTLDSKLQAFLYDTDYSTEKMELMLHEDIQKYWHKKDFKEFNYLHIYIHWGWKLADLILTIGLCVGAYFFVEKQDFGSRSSFIGSPRIYGRY